MDRRPPERGAADRAFEALFLTLVVLLPVMQPHALFRGYVVPPADFVFPLAAAAFLVASAAGRPMASSALHAPIAAYAAALCASTLMVFVVRATRARLGSESPPLAFAVALAFIGGVLYQSIGGSFEHARHVWVVIGVAAAIGGRLR